MKKIAICISGHLRTYKRALSNFIEFLHAPLRQIGDVDIFLSTCPIKSSNDTWQGQLGNKQDDSIIDINEAIKTYGAIATFIEDQQQTKNLFQTTNFIDEVPPICDPRRHSNGKLNFIPMWYGVNQCNELKKQKENSEKFVYDLVIKTRPDLLYPYSIDINRILSNLENTLWVGKEAYFTEGSQYQYENGWNIRDMFAMGNSEIMDKYSSLYSHLEILLKNNYTEVPERILWEHLQNFHFNIKAIYEDTPVLR